MPGDGTLVMVGAGTAHGVHPLGDGRSPFHFARRRLDLVEPPHMHTSMVFVPAGDPAPRCGDIVDVQRPLISDRPSTRCAGDDGRRRRRPTAVTTAGCRDPTSCGPSP